MILSIDLASRRYSDNGIALLAEGMTSVDVELITPSSIGLVGEPDAEHFALAILELAQKRGVRLIVLDGPQGWKGIASTLVHSRSCERATLTPGKTGVEGQVKPQSWTRMAVFSIKIFDALERGGWPRMTSSWSGERATVESFPTHAWRCLGHTPLPGKGKGTALAQWSAILRDGYVKASLGDASHDELQAVVAGMAGLQLMRGGLAACDVRGEAPYLEGGVWREGFIISPRPVA